MTPIEQGLDYHDRWVRPYVAVILSAAFVWGFVVDKISQEFFGATYSVVLGFYFAQRAAQAANAQAQQAAANTAATTAAAVLAGAANGHTAEKLAASDTQKDAAKEPPKP